MDPKRWDQAIAVCLEIWTDDEWNAAILELWELWWWKNMMQNFYIQVNSLGKPFKGIKTNRLTVEVKEIFERQQPRIWRRRAKRLKRVMCLCPFEWDACPVLRSQEHENCFPQLPWLCWRPWHVHITSESISHYFAYGLIVASLVEATQHWPLIFWPWSTVQS